MTAEEYARALEIVNKMLTILGNVSLTDAKDWIQVKANAESLKAEIEANNPEEE